MIYELNHFGIFTQDDAAALAFYEKLDAQIVFDRSIAAAGVRVLYLQLGDGMIELVCRPDAPADWRYGIDHLAFMSDDLDADHERLLEAGCLESEAPKKAGTGVGRLAFVTRDGGRVELLQRDVDFRRPFDGSGIVKGFDHYAWTVPDLEASATFFRDVVGMAPLAELRAADGAPVRQFLGLKGDAVGLGQAGSARAPGVFPYFALRVENVDDALEELRRRGLDAGASEPSGSGLGRTALIDGPDGVRIELLDRAPLSPDVFTTAADDVPAVRR